MARETWEWTILDPRFTIGGPWRKDSFSPQCEADVWRVGHLSLGHQLLVILGIYFPINHISLKWTNRFYPSYIWTHGCYSSELISPVFQKDIAFYPTVPTALWDHVLFFHKLKVSLSYAGTSVGPMGNVAVYVMTFPSRKNAKTTRMSGRSGFVPLSCRDNMRSTRKPEEHTLSQSPFRRMIHIRGSYFR
jgi:hypothetical protein